MNTLHSYWNSHIPYIEGSDIDFSLTKLLDEIHRLINARSKIYTFGNGGSAATAEHFAADLNLTQARVNRKISAFCLSSQISTSTALANDFSLNESCAMQVQNHLASSDVLVLFTASGNSQNIVSAANAGIKLGASVHVFVGFDGGEVSKLAGINLIHIKSPIGQYGRIENIHSAICHFIIDEINNGI
jgi:D-sedoheptulose 7-phosphate isomerase